MKILAVKPLKGGSLPVIEYSTRALKTLGCDVIEIGFSCRDIESFKKALSTVNTLIIQLLKEQKPDILFGVAQSPIFKPVLDYCKKHHILTVYWFVENYKVFTYWQEIAKSYDLFCIIQKGEFKCLLDRMGVKSLYLPLAADPAIHKPLALTPEEKNYYGSSISFVGAGYPNRVTLFEKLIKELPRVDFKIWGSDWNIPKNSVLRKFLQRNGERIPVEEYVKIFNASSVNLNPHSSLMGNEFSGGDFVNPRTFEIALARAFQIVDKRSLLGELFVENSEIAVYSSFEELKEIIKKAVNDSDYRSEIATMSYRRVLKDHTYLKRMQRLLEKLKENP